MDRDERRPAIELPHPDRQEQELLPPPSEGPELVADVGQAEVLAACQDLLGDDVDDRAALHRALGWRPDGVPPTRGWDPDPSHRERYP